MNRRNLFRATIAAATTAALGPETLAAQAASWQAILNRLQAAPFTYLGGMRADAQMGPGLATPQDVQAHIQAMIDEGVQSWTLLPESAWESGSAIVHPESHRYRIGDLLR